MKYVLEHFKSSSDLIGDFDGSGHSEDKVYIYKTPIPTVRKNSKKKLHWLVQSTK